MSTKINSMIDGPKGGRNKNGGIKGAANSISQYFGVTDPK